MREGWLGRAYGRFSLRIAPSKFYTFGADGKGLAQEQRVPNRGLQDPCDVGVEGKKVGRLALVASCSVRWGSSVPERR